MVGSNDLDASEADFVTVMAGRADRGFDILRHLPTGERTWDVDSADFNLDGVVDVRRIWRPCPAVEIELPRRTCRSRSRRRRSRLPVGNQRPPRPTGPVSPGRARGAPGPGRSVHRQRMDLQAIIPLSPAL